MVKEVGRFKQFKDGNKEVQTKEGGNRVENLNKLVRDRKRK